MAAVSVKVFVIDAEGTSLLPTHPARARKLLDGGKAVLLRVVPYTIRLTRIVEQPVGAFTVGIDDGAKWVGLAVVNPHTQEAVFMGTIQLRQDVSHKLTQRASFRRARRQRNTRYRPARFLNRHRAESWLSPSIRQRKDSIVRVVTDLQKLMPVASAVVEQGQFDVASMAAGRQLSGQEYQIPNYEGRKFRAKVLWRDKYTCQHCGSQSELQAHHIHPRHRGGSNTPHNGITLCADCHRTLHEGEWVLDKAPKRFQYPAHLQIGKRYLYKQLAGLALNVERCWGWMTSYWRQELGLVKSHEQDAVAMVCREYVPAIACRSYKILPKRKQVWADNPTKVAEEKGGFRHWDLVKAEHRNKGVVIGSVRSLKALRLTLRTGWDDNFEVSYRKARLLWRFKSIIYI